VDKQAAVPGGVKADKYYNLLLAVNGVNAILVVDNKNVFTHTYAPRVVDGYSYGLNWGMVGVGSDNSRGSFDNIAVQILPPQLTFDETENFAGAPELAFGGYQSGAWSAGGGVYSATPGGETGISLLDLGPDNLAFSSYLELTAKVSTAGRAGFVFDRYDDGSFKFVAIDAPADRVIIGHYTPRSGWVSDAAVAKSIGATASYTLGVSLKGTTVSVTLDGQTLVGFAFNAATVDGRFGLLATGGQASFDDVRVRTNDPAFIEEEGASLNAAATYSGSGATLTQAQLDAAATVAISEWIDALGDGDARLAAFGDVRFAIADLAGSELGHAQGNAILVDADAAGHGWGAMDLATVVTHELGHLLGFDHDDAGALAVMHDSLDTGERYRLEAGGSAPAAQPAAQAHGAPMIEFGPSIAIDWQAGSSDGWGVKLSPYAPDKPAKSAAANFTGFKVQLLDKPKPFDSLGRALLGKDQGR
jgi:hypothetical protein